MADIEEMKRLGINPVARLGAIYKAERKTPPPPSKAKLPPVSPQELRAACPDYDKLPPERRLKAIRRLEREKAEREAEAAEASAKAEAVMQEAVKAELHARAVRAAADAAQRQAAQLGNAVEADRKADATGEGSQGGDHAE